MVGAMTIAACSEHSTVSPLLKTIAGQNIDPYETVTVRTKFGNCEPVCIIAHKCMP